MSRLPSRSGVYGGWWGPGMGDVASDAMDVAVFVSNDPLPVDPSTLYPEPGYNIQTAPGPDMTAAELAVEQARATAWLNQLPNVISTAGKVALTAAQITAGIAAGTVKPSSTCPGGYLVAGTGQCVQPQGAGFGAPLIAGVDNKTLLLVGVGVLFLMMISSSGGRRR